MKAVGVVANLWRYPVKSMLGEARPSLSLDDRGVAGDRLFGVRTDDGKIGSGKDTRRFARIDGLFGFRSVYDGLVPVITLPDGREVRGDDAAVDATLSEALGRTVTLAREQSVSHFDNSPIHLVTTASLRWLASRLPESVVDERRFRPNIVVASDESGPAEQDWLGRTLSVGRNVTLEITRPTERCHMTNFWQPDVPEDRRIFACIGREADLTFGVYARVLAPGLVRRGDEVKLA